MTFDPFLAEQRFGYGHRPGTAGPADADDMLRALSGPDLAAQAYPLPPFRFVQDALVSFRRFASYARKNPDTAEGAEAQETANAIRRDMRQAHGQWFIQFQLRRVMSPQTFRERLVAFWGDHFTALGKNALLRHAAPIYLEEAVRPNINGPFADLLTACVTHPLMLHYLDQNSSAGPNSRAAERSDRVRGLNENLAREVLELHTLGVDGPYGQADVREFAKLLTGLAATRNYGFKFRPMMTEPGSETVLGKTYAAEGGMDPIRAVLQDLARHPATAAHVARKLAVHFVSDAPPADLVAHVTQAYLRSDGMLSACYEALLEHPQAWQRPAVNMRPPDEFVSAALRALGLSEQTLGDVPHRTVQTVFFRPLQMMGQPWLSPTGPDGFAEEDAAWVTPQGLSARLDWAVSAPSRLMQSLPDPRTFVRDALGDDAPEAVIFAANAAEDRKVAIGLVLASPAFQRR